LRLLCLQKDIADRVLDMLAGHAETLRIGDPARLETDVGPVIDESARAALDAHCARMDREARKLFQCTLEPECARGTFFAPRAYEIDAVERIGGEVFGPVLHVLRYPASALDSLLAAVHATGYALTLAIHTRVRRMARRIQRALPVGNTYVNRNQIGAVVGVQPFGGERLSGTGPKAGGPHYLPRFAVERTLTWNTTSSGGNAALVSLDED
jgi:RHH-type proline utilization regulon transcriptional repressor/proline dehydrogenase/delta 1-pyrroline-5-carboxylate dehydrogenase